LASDVLSMFDREINIFLITSIEQIKCYL